MTAYDYFVESFNGPIDGHRLWQFGEAGWLMTGVAVSSGKWTYYFARPKVSGT